MGSSIRCVFVRVRVCACSSQCSGCAIKAIDYRQLFGSGNGSWKWTPVDLDEPGSPRRAGPGREQQMSVMMK